MKIVILSGGKGYRFKEETEWRPKPMIPIGEKPIIWHIMKIYQYYGYDDFIIALGYKSDYIKDFFINHQYLVNDFTMNLKTGEKVVHGNGEKVKDNFHITFVDTGLETLPGERVLHLKKYIKDDDFMLTYGDGLSDIDITKLVSFHNKNNSIATITGVHPRSSYGIVHIGRDNFATKFSEKPVLADWINGGFMVFKNEALKYFRKGETEHAALKRLVRKGNLSVYKHIGFWHSMDTYRDWDELNKIWKEGAPWKVW